jgi:hypothetical protein
MISSYDPSGHGGDTWTLNSATESKKWREKFSTRSCNVQSLTIKEDIYNIILYNVLYTDTYAGTNAYTQTHTRTDI